MLVTSDDFSARLFERISRDRIVQYKGHRRTVTGATFSPGNRLVATSSDDTTALIWHVAGTDAPPEGLKLSPPAAHSPSWQTVIRSRLSHSRQHPAWPE